jgi:hypothetical protein
MTEQRSEQGGPEFNRGAGPLKAVKWHPLKNGLRPSTLRAPYPRELYPARLTSQVNFCEK